MRLALLAAAAMGSVMALVGFAGAANASATVDLIWIDKTDTACTDLGRRDCPQLGDTISSVAVTGSITLAVIITAGPAGVMSAGVSVDYSDALPTLNVTDFGRFNTEPFLTFGTGVTTDMPPFIDNVNAASLPAIGSGIGLSAGQSAYLGTVSFHKDLVINGIFEIAVGTDGPGGTDGVRDFVGNVIDSTTTFNSAYLLTVTGEPPPCRDSQGNSMEIEINALRAGGKTIRASLDQTVDVTAKARILKGTAVSGTTIDTTLTIEALDGATVIGTNSTPFEAITLRVGKSGNGAKLTVDVPQCTAGFIEFVAIFVGTDGYGDGCRQTRKLRKECR
jgi:hypothetical protein